MTTQVTDEPAPVVTDRMRQVLDGIAAGKKNHEIAGDLGISPKTVEKFRAQLYEAFAVDSAVALVMKALRMKVISL